MADSSGGGASLQFETAVPAGGSPAADGGAVRCGPCGQPVTSTYYDVSGTTTCASCRTAMGQMMEMRGEMMKAMGEVMLKHAKKLQETPPAPAK